MNIKLMSIAATVSLASAIAFAVPAANVKGYLTSSDGKVITSGCGLCWEHIWTNPSACGEEPALAPMAEV